MEKSIRSSWHRDPKKHHLCISELFCVTKMMLEFGDGVLKHILHT